MKKKPEKAQTPSYKADPVTAAPDVEALFTDPDPVLHRNKQAAYHIFKVLDEAGHWERAAEFMTERYIQHNPFVASGRESDVKRFTEELKVKPQPIADKLRMKVVSVVAQGDLVVIACVRTLPDPQDPSKIYTSTWFDMFRFVDGKADEHWDCATLDLTEPPNLE